MTALEYFRLMAPEYAALSDATVTVWLEVAADQAADVSGCLSAEGTARAQALYAAHLQRVTATQASGASGALGPVKSEREGDLSRTYGTVKGDNTWLGQTPYGQQYRDLTAPCSGLGILTRVSVGSL